MPATTTTITPRIYIACLGCYNSGKLNGHWFDVDDYCTDPDGLADDINNAFGADPVSGRFACGDICPHEETAIHDFEGFGSYKVDEYDSITYLCALVRLAEVENYGGAVYALAAYEPSTYSDIDALRTAFEEHYRGRYDNARDFAQQFHDDMGTEIPDWVEYYIDWDRMGRDMLINEFYSINDDEGGIYVFRRH